MPKKPVPAKRRPPASSARKPSSGDVVVDVDIASDRGGLSDKQWVFVESYLTCWNATRAAVSAGYSAHTAHVQGFRLLRNATIARAIEQRIAEHHMTADEVLSRLAEHARGSMSDFIDPTSVSIDLAKAQRANKLNLIKKVKYTIFTKDDAQTETVEFELYDAQSALVHLGKHLSLFTDKSINLNLTPADLAAMSDEQLEALRDGKPLPARTGV